MAMSSEIEPTTGPRRFTDLLNSRLVFQFAILLVAIWYTFEAFKIPAWSRGQPDSGLLPQIVGILWVVATALSLARDVRRRATCERTRYLPDQAIAGILCAMLIPLIIYLGLTTAMIIFMLAALAKLNPGRHIQNLLLSVILPIALWYAFANLFGSLWTYGYFGIPGYL